MLAMQIIQDLQARGFTVRLTEEGKVRVTPASQLTDEDRHRLKCYKTELLWRLRHPEGDPPLGEYMANVFIDGERVRIPMARLIAEGREIIEREGLQPKTAGLDPDLWAASVALGDTTRRIWNGWRAVTHSRVRRQAH